VRQITDVKRNKRTYDLPLPELKKGDWLKLITEGALVELSYKNGYLTINECFIKKQGEKPLEGTENGTRPRDK